MATCGDAYAAKLRTRLGTTPDAPLWGLGAVSGVAGIEDWAAWRALAVDLDRQAVQAFERLGELETQRGRGFTQWNRAVLPMRDLEKAREKLPAMFAARPAKGVPLAVVLCQAAACALETADEGLRSLGARADTGEPVSHWTSWALPAAVAGGIGLLIYRDLRSPPDVLVLEVDE